MRQSKRRRQQQQRETEFHGNLHMERIEAKTKNQQLAIQAFRNGNHCILKGSAGTGKTIVSLAVAIEAVVQQGQYSKIIILRSARSTVDIGHLPGSAKEKVEVFEPAFKDNVNKLFDDQTAYDKLKAKNVIRFESTSFLRGLTFDDAVVIVDEAQNLSRQEAHTIATRMGENSQLIVLGDKAQLDYMKNEKSGFEWFCGIMEKVPNVAIVEFTAADVVRSGFVKQYLFAFEADFARQQRKSTIRQLELV